MQPQPEPYGPADSSVRELILRFSGCVTMFLPLQRHSPSAPPVKAQFTCNFQALSTTCPRHAQQAESLLYSRRTSFISFLESPSWLLRFKSGRETSLTSFPLEQLFSHYREYKLEGERGDARARGRCGKGNTNEEESRVGRGRGRGRAENKQEDCFKSGHDQSHPPSPSKGLFFWRNCFRNKLHRDEHLGASSEKDGGPTLFRETPSQAEAPLWSPPTVGAHS